MDPLARTSKLWTVMSLALLATLAAAPATRAETLFGLRAVSTIQRVDSAAPAVLSMATVSGRAANEVVAGVDDPPQDVNDLAAEAPTAAILSPAGGGVYALGAEVWTSVSCTEGARGPGIGTCADADGDTEGSGLLDTDTAGRYTYVLEAVSRSGLSATATISYTVKAPPAAPLLRGPASPSQPRSLVIRGTADAGTTVSIYAKRDCRGPVQATAPAAILAGAGIALFVRANATTRLFATAVDDLGQVSACSAALVNVNDTLPPNTAITMHPRRTVTSHRATFRFKLVQREAGATLQCRLDRGRWRTCKTRRTVLVKRGRHSFSVRARDRAGNADTTPARFSWRVR